MLPRELYTPDNRAQLQTRYEDVCLAICHTHRELAQSQVAELQAYVSSVTNSKQSTITAMDKEAVVASSAFKFQVFTDRGELAALEAERDLIREMLHGDS